MIVFRVFCSGFFFLLTWTLGVHLVTFGALSFVTLYWVGALAFLAAVFGAFKPAVFAFVFADSTNALPRPAWVYAPTSADRNRVLMYLGAALTLFLVTAGIQYKFSLAEPFWIACLGVAGISFWVSRRTNWCPSISFNQEIPTVSASGRDVAFFVATAAVLIFYFFTSVPDPDDSLFLNLAVGAKETRDAVFSTDTMLGIPGLDLIKSTYRLESYQLLTALISDITGLPVTLVAHSVVPGFICVWAASVLTLIHASLFPRVYGSTLIFHFLLLIAMDGALQSYGYHAIPRFFQGKGPYVTVMVPLIAVLTWFAMRSGSWRTLFALAGALVISIGFSANAIYAAPLAIALIGATWLFVGGNCRWRAVRLPLVVLYPFAFALYLIFSDPPGPSEFTSAGTIGGMFWGIWGSPPVMVAGLALLFTAMLSPLLSPKLLPLSIYFAVALCFVLNPLLLQIYAEHVTGYINVRLFWTIPTTFLIAVLFGVLWSSGWRPIRIGIVAVLLAGILGPGSILNKAEFGFAALKVPQTEFAIAQRVVRSDLEDHLLLAPESISAWITVLEDRPPVVEGRWLYIPQRVDPRYRDVLDRRASIYTFFNRDPTMFANDEDFLSALADVGIGAVLLDVASVMHGDLEPALVDAGYEVLWNDGGYTLLVL